MPNHRVDLRDEAVGLPMASDLISTGRLGDSASTSPPGRLLRPLLRVRPSALGDRRVPLPPLPPPRRGTPPGATHRTPCPASTGRAAGPRPRGPAPRRAPCPARWG